MLSRGDRNLSHLRRPCRRPRERGRTRMLRKNRLLWRLSTIRRAVLPWRLRWKRRSNLGRRPRPETAGRELLERWQREVQLQLACGDKFALAEGARAAFAK